MSVTINIGTKEKGSQGTELCLLWCLEFQKVYMTRELVL